MPKIRKAFTISVVAGPIKPQEYINHHNLIWPELSLALEDHGVSNYSIFLDPASGQLIGYVEIESEEQWQDLVDTDVYKRWWAHMTDILPVNPFASALVEELEGVFHLD